MNTTPRGIDVAIVGGGLAGLAAAAYLARSGLVTRVLERASHLGGRASTHLQDGFHFNQGPHALYRGGAAHAVLAELGVRFSGASPGVEGLAWSDGALHVLPTSPRSLLSTSLLGARGKLEVAKLMAMLGAGGIDAAAIAGVPLATWLDRTLRDPGARALGEALARLSTYTNAPGELSAGAAVSQLAMAAKAGVLYLDRGWQTLIDGLAAKAREAAAEIHTGVDVAGVESAADGVTVHLAGGLPMHARAALIAASPGAAHRLADGGGSAFLATAAAAARPVHAACLDVALRTLPDPVVRFALGIDRPLYFSVHTSAARLAPPGGALIHLAKYLPLEDIVSEPDDRTELEAFLDRLQPGWRDVLVHERFLRRMVVQHAVVSARHGDLAGRPDVQVGDRPGIFIAGDWVGPVGSLADASLASARRAALAITAHLGSRATRAA